MSEFSLYDISVDDAYAAYARFRDECPAARSDVFTPFGERRAKNRTGLGLGLSIARRAVRAQGGDIEVRNSPGKGCTFIIQVPAATADAPSAAVDTAS